MYRVTEKEMEIQRTYYRNNYPPFVPFKLSPEDSVYISKNYKMLLTTQNGPDFDDYIILDDNKIEKYLNKFPTDSRVLFLGTGVGRELCVGRDMGFDIYGTTFGSRNVYFGVNYLGINKDRLIECANEALPFDGGFFDVVAGFQVFEHTLSPLQFLIEQYRVLKVGGTLILEWPPAYNHQGGNNPHHQVCFVPGQAQSLFEKAGFENIKMYYDNLKEIPSDCIWRGDVNLDLMLCIEGKKIKPLHPYVNMSY